MCNGISFFFYHNTYHNIYICICIYNFIYVTEHDLLATHHFFYSICVQSSSSLVLFATPHFFPRMIIFRHTHWRRKENSYDEKLKKYQQQQQQPQQHHHQPYLTASNKLSHSFAKLLFQNYFMHE